MYSKSPERVREYNKQYRLDNPEKIKFLEHRRNTQRIRFRGKQIDLDHNPRTGVCTKCGFVGYTHLHHTKYDDTDPLKYTVELCVGCHNKERIGVKYKK